MIRNARRALRRATGQRKGRLHRAINDLDTIIERTERVVAQTRSRLAGVMPESATRLVSLHDPDARPIRKGRLGKPGRVRLQSPGRRQRRRRHPRPQRRDREPRRRPAAGARDRTDHPPHRHVPARGDRRPRLRRGQQSNTTSTSSACATSRSPARANPARPAASSNTAERSATRSNGAPDARAGSTTSNAATAGTAPNSPASTAPEPGADTESSPTTSSRSVHSRHETLTRAAPVTENTIPTRRSDGH